MELNQAPDHDSNQPAHARTSRRAIAILVVAILLAALATPVVDWLVRHGGTLGISNPDAVSFCNILFVGNACAGLVVLGAVGWRPLWGELRTTSRRTALWLFANLLIGSVAGPVLLYKALESTSVTNIVLLIRVESVAYSVLGVLLFRETISRMSWVGQGVIVLGAVLLVLSQGTGRLARGDAMAVGSGLLYALGTALGKQVLVEISMPTFLFTRNLVGAAVFFWIAVGMYGPEHFADAFSRELWVVMMVYATVVVVSGQYFWFRAVETVPASTVATWSCAVPVLGIGFAWLMLSQVPNAGQLTCAAVIVTGVVVSQIRSGEPTAEPRVIERSLAGG